MAQPWIIRRRVDLARDFVGVERIAALATTSSKAAHQLQIEVCGSGASIDLSGAGISLNLILPDGSSTTVNGSVAQSTCCATLPPLCYQRGETRGVLMIDYGTQAYVPVYAFVLLCYQDVTDVFVDPNHTIPSISELLAQIEATKAAEKEALDGAKLARTAAQEASCAADLAGEAAQSASDSAKTAIAAAKKASESAERLDSMTATATGLPTGSAPTVTVSTNADGARVLSFGIPRGDVGPQGPVGPKGEDGTVTFEALTDEQRESLRGPQGVQGEQGPAGPAGEDGYTPVKGTDYFTQEDRAQLVSQVLAALPNASGVGF